MHVPASREAAGERSIREKGFCTIAFLPGEEYDTHTWLSARSKDARHGDQATKLFKIDILMDGIKYKWLAYVKILLFNSQEIYIQILVILNKDLPECSKVNMNRLANFIKLSQNDKIRDEKTFPNRWREETGKRKTCFYRILSHLAGESGLRIRPPLKKKKKKRPQAFSDTTQKTENKTTAPPGEILGWYSAAASCWRTTVTLETNASYVPYLRGFFTLSDNAVNDAERKHQIMRSSRCWGTDAIEEKYH